MELSPGMGSLLGGAISAFGQYSTNKQNINQAQKQMNFQREMSNTAYQRSMADMKKAGLNPILMSKWAGASTPSGSMATLQNPASAGISSALQASQVSKTEAETENTKVDKLNKELDLLLKRKTIPRADTINKAYTVLDKSMDLIKSVKDSSVVKKLRSKITELKVKYGLEEVEIGTPEYYKRKHNPKGK